MDLFVSIFKYNFKIILCKLVTTDLHNMIHERFSSLSLLMNENNLTNQLTTTGPLYHLRFNFDYA